MMAVFKRVVAPAIVVALALPAATAMAAAPANDNFQNARQLQFFESGAGTTVDATLEANEPLTANEPAPQHVCSTRRLDHTVWYEIPGSGGPVTVHTRGSAVDTIIVAYNTDSDPTSDPPSFANAINCNDDISDEDQSSELTFDTQAGIPYLIQVGACSGCHDGSVPEEGAVDFVAYDTPPNDNRASARALTSGAPLAGDNNGATLEGTSERNSCA